MHKDTYDSTAPLVCEWPRKSLGVMVSCVIPHAQYPETGAMQIEIEVPTLGTMSLGRWTAPQCWQEKAREDTLLVLEKIRAIREELGRHEARLLAEMDSLQPGGEDLPVQGDAE